MNTVVFVMLKFHSVGYDKLTAVGNPSSAEVLSNAVNVFSDVFPTLIVKCCPFLPYVVSSVA